MNDSVTETKESNQPYTRELDLPPFPVSVALAIGEDEWIQICEKNEFKDRTWMADNSLGEVSGMGSVVVVRFADLSSYDIIKRAGVCAHEAVHVFQALCQYINETEPSTEFAAYYVQAITQWLLKELECSLSQVSTSSSQEQQSSQESLDSTSSETGEQAAS